MGIIKKIKQIRQLFKFDLSMPVSSILSGVAIWSGTKKKDSIDAYSTNIDVYRVINKVTDAIKTIPVVLNEGQGADKKQIDNHELLKLLNRPNRDQTWSEFLVSACSMKMITGDGFIFAPSHIDGANKGKPSEMWIIPSQYMTIVYDKSVGLVTGYKLQMDGVEKNFLAEDVIHYKQFNPNIEGDGRSLYGMSKLIPGSRTIAVSSEAQTSQKKSFQNSGAAGLITYDGSKVAMGQSGQSSMTQDWEQGYTGSINQGKTAWLNFDAKWQKIGMSPVDLQTIAAQQHTLNGIAGLYNVPMELVNPEAKQSYQSPKEARKALYTEAAIPEFLELLNALSKHLVPLFDKANSIWLWYDKSDIDALQTDRKSQVEWLEKAWWLTPNEKRAVMGIEESTEIDMDTVWTPSNLLPINQEDISKPVKE